LRPLADSSRSRSQKASFFILEAIVSGVYHSRLGANSRTRIWPSPLPREATLRSSRFSGLGIRTGDVRLVGWSLKSEVVATAGTLGELLRSAGSQVKDSHLFASRTRLFSFRHRSLREKVHLKELVQQSKSQSLDMSGSPRLVSNTLLTVAASWPRFPYLHRCLVCKLRDGVNVRSSLRAGPGLCTHTFSRPRRPLRTPNGEA
jgi:hypothetical protein